MQNLRIDTIRDFEPYPSYLILYEFEDDFIDFNKVRIHNLSNKKYTIGKMVYKAVPNFHINRRKNDNLIFSVMMTPDYHRLYFNKTNVIPYVIDYWKKYDELFEKNFIHFPLVYISGLEVYEYLKAKKTKVNIKHLPLSISDRHLSLFNKEITKDIDIINIGRKNKIIDGYIQQYISKYTSTNYVHREMENGQNIYYSSIHGKLGKLETRDDLLQILSRSKVAIVTSPGIDGGEERTGGFNPVTPRVFEAAVGKCYLVGKYETNNEFYDFGLDKLVNMPVNYNEFETTVNDKLNTPFNLHNTYQTFLQANLNSLRIKQINDDLQKANF